VAKSGEQASPLRSVKVYSPVLDIELMDPLDSRLDHSYAVIRGTGRSVPRMRFRHHRRRRSRGP